MVCDLLSALLLLLELLFELLVLDLPPPAALATTPMATIASITVSTLWRANQFFLVSLSAIWITSLVALISEGYPLIKKMDSHAGDCLGSQASCYAYSFVRSCPFLGVTTQIMIASVTRLHENLDKRDYTTLPL